MSRLKKYAKKSKEEYHQYPWKVDYELFALFSKYCESLNLSVNEGLSHLVSDEIESFKQEMTEEELRAVLDEFRVKKGFVPRDICHPGHHGFPPRGGIPPVPPNGRPFGHRPDSEQD